MAFLVSFPFVVVHVPRPHFVVSTTRPITTTNRANTYSVAAAVVAWVAGGEWRWAVTWVFACVDLLCCFSDGVSKRARAEALPHRHSSASGDSGAEDLLSPQCTDTSPLVLRVPKLSLRQQAAFFMSIRWFWKQASSILASPSKATAAETAAPSASVASVLAADTNQQTSKVAANSDVPGPDTEIGTDFRTFDFDAADIAETASLTGSNSPTASLPLVIECLGGLAWPWESTRDCLLLSRGGETTIASVSSGNTGICNSF